MSEATNQWGRIAEQARAGEVHVGDEAAARQALKGCNDYIDELQALLAMAEQTKYVSGFGDFPMAAPLVEKFNLQSTGTENSIDAVIMEHIRVVKDMRDVMAISIARLSEQDYTNAETLESIVDEG